MELSVTTLVLKRPPPFIPLYLHGIIFSIPSCFFKCLECIIVVERYQSIVSWNLYVYTLLFLSPVLFSLVPWHRYIGTSKGSIRSPEAQHWHPCFRDSSAQCTEGWETCLSTVAVHLMNTLCLREVGPSWKVIQQLHIHHWALFCRGHTVHVEHVSSACWHLGALSDRATVRRKGCGIWPELLTSVYPRERELGKMFLGHILIVQGVL